MSIKKHRWDIDIASLTLPPDSMILEDQCASLFYPCTGGIMVLDCPQHTFTNAFSANEECPVRGVWCRPYCVP